MLVYFMLASLFFCEVSAKTSYEELVSGKKASYISTADGSYAVLQIMDPIVNIATTKEYAQHVMDSYQGWDLRAVVDLRGFSFRYVDNAPCSGLVTFFDGRSYLFFQSCGNFSESELSTLFDRASKALKIQELLNRHSKPNY